MKATNAENYDTAKIESWRRQFVHTSTKCPIKISKFLRTQGEKFPAKRNSQPFNIKF